jgi:hypothetical protein
MRDRRALLTLVAGRSPAAQVRALEALRALEVGSPIVDRRIARVAAEALRDPAAAWTDAERETLAEAAGIALAGPEADEPARARLSALVEAWTAAGRSQAAFARDVLGRDADSLGAWLGGKPLPGSLADWVGRIRSITVREIDGVVSIRVEPRAMGTPGRKPLTPR